MRDRPRRHRRHPARPGLLPALLAVALPVALASPADAHPRFAAAFLGYPAPFGLIPVAAADLDGDSHPDVAIAAPGSMVVRFGVGDGTLGPPQALPAGSGVFVAAGDLDGDGDTDLVTQGDSLAIAVMLGDGAGAFAAPVEYPCDKSPTRAAIAQLEPGGIPDLVTLNPRSGSVSVFLGAGAGTFAPRTDLAAGPWPVGLAIGDFDGDADLDLAVGNPASATITPFVNDGLGHFTAATAFPTVAGLSDLGAAFLDGDTMADLVATSATPLVASHLALGGGTFAGAVTRPLPGAPLGLRFADLDADGHADVVTTAPDLNSVLTLRSAGDGTFDAPRGFHCPRAPWDLDVADLNGGGKPDVVVVSQLGWLAVLPGNGDATLGGLDEYATGPNPSGVAVGDVNGDAVPDAVTANASGQTISVLAGNGDGSFAPRTDFPVGLHPWAVALADLDGDSDLDAAVANSGPGTQTSSTVSVLLGDGAGGFGPHTEFAVGRWPRSIAAGDLDGDGHPDVVVGEGDAGASLSVLYGDGTGALGSRQSFALGSLTSAVAIGDATGDGIPDVAAAAYDGRFLAVVPGNGDRTWDAPVTLPTPSWPGSVAVGDVTADGIADVVGSGGAVWVFAGLGGGAFAPRADHPASGGALAIGDFDEDGAPDVVTANGWNSNTVSLLAGEGGGALAPEIAYGAGDLPAALAAADANGDGRPDLVIANRQAGTLSVLPNSGGQPWARWLGVPAPPAPPAPALGARPNPASGALTVEFSLARASEVRLRAYDVAGRLLATLAAGRFEAGPHALGWSRDARDASGIGAGVCFLELRAGSERRVRRVVLLR